MQSNRLDKLWLTIWIYKFDETLSCHLWPVAASAGAAEGAERRQRSGGREQRQKQQEQQQQQLQEGQQGRWGRSWPAQAFISACGGGTVDGPRQEEPERLLPSSAWWTPLLARFSWVRLYAALVATMQLLQRGHEQLRLQPAVQQVCAERS